MLANNYITVYLDGERSLSPSRISNINALILSEISQKSITWNYTRIYQKSKKRREPVRLAAYHFSMPNNLLFLLGFLFFIWK